MDWLGGAKGKPNPPSFPSAPMHPLFFWFVPDLVYPRSDSYPRMEVILTPYGV